MLFGRVREGLDRLYSNKDFVLFSLFIHQGLRMSSSYSSMQKSESDSSESPLS
jgi:hypothetical protein